MLNLLLFSMTPSLQLFQVIISFLSPPTPNIYPCAGSSEPVTCCCVMEQNEQHSTFGHHSKTCINITIGWIQFKVLTTTLSSSFKAFWDKYLKSKTTNRWRQYSNRVYQLIIEQAHKEFNSLVDQIAAKSE